MTQHNSTHPDTESPQSSEQHAHAAALCPYCGHENPAAAAQCAQCRGLFEPLSRQASQNAMGPWFVRDPQRPFQPGMSFSTLRNLVARGKITRRTILRGPTTRQFWAYAEDTPGVATLLSLCHACHASVRPDEFLCRACNSTLSPQTDRQGLGLAPVRLLPGQGTPEEIADNWTVPPPAQSPKTPAKPVSNGPIAPTTTISTARPETPAPLPTTTTAPTSSSSTIAAPAKPSASPAGDSGAQRRARMQLISLRRWLAISIALNGVLLIAVLIAFAIAGTQSDTPTNTGAQQPAPTPESIAPLDHQPIERAQTPPLRTDEGADAESQDEFLQRARELLRDPK